jgi:aspartyl-tRNA(Asn)/glutamyl-tRNA(Gln) amidotransferase subunit A
VKPDARDAMSLPHQDIAWTAPERDPRGLKIALWMDAGWGLPLDDDVRAAIEEAARRFEAAGATVVPVPAFTTRAMADGMDTFWRMRAWLDIVALPVERQRLVLPYIFEWAARGATASGEAVFRGYSQMAALRDAGVAALQGFDFMIGPVAPIPTYAAELAGPTGDPQRPFEHIAFTLPFNMSEQPAASVPCGFTKSGLPVGLQIIGHRHDDLGVLQLSRTWERLRAPLRPWPEPPSS